VLSGGRASDLPGESVMLADPLTRAIKSHRTPNNSESEQLTFDEWVDSFLETILSHRGSASHRDRGGCLPQPIEDFGGTMAVSM